MATFSIPPSRLCPDCSADISARNHQAIRCADCQLAYRRTYNKAKSHTWYLSICAPKPPRICSECDIDISDRGGKRNAKWCVECAIAIDKQRRQTAEHKEKAIAYGYQRRQTQAYVDWRNKHYQSERFRDRHASNSHRRRARELGQLGHVSKGIKSALQKAQGNKCAFCHAAFRKVKAHLDHIVPLAKGGLHDDTNLQVLCQRCNNRKKDKDPIAFARENGRLL